MGVGMGHDELVGVLGSPAQLWENFMQLARIPRMSLHETEVLAWVTAKAEAHALVHRSDATGNLVVFRPGSGGGEAAGTCIVQGHLDMVCEKDNDVQHDFLLDPIRLKVVDSWLKAEGTTLGADNGIGVAAALALMTAPPTAKLPPIEFLFTVVMSSTSDCLWGYGNRVLGSTFCCERHDHLVVHPSARMYNQNEETGLTGAKALSNSELQLKGRVLINMDTEEWGEVCIGCAGGGDTAFQLPVEQEAMTSGWTAMVILVTGLKGGHSGCNIHECRANAVKCVAEVCQAAADACPELRIATIQAGDKRNAIAREGRAVVLVPAAHAASASAAMAEYIEALTQSYSRFETAMHIDATTTQAPQQMMTAASGRALLSLLVALPHGVQQMSHSMPGLVETSNNVASVSVADGSAKIVCTTRSSVGGSLVALRSRLKVIGELCGATVSQNEAYPGWNPSPESATVQLVKELYQEHFQTDPQITAIHAGLECGILNSRLGGGLDMVSYGPTIREAHSPNEMCHIPSVAKFWDLTQALMQRLADVPAQV